MTPDEQPQPVASELLPAIEFNETYKDRAYIPLPGGWEIQTKGGGSSFRICNTKTGDRLNVTPQPYVYEMLEQMAREIHAAWNTRAHPPTSAASLDAVRVTELLAKWRVHYQAIDLYYGKYRECAMLGACIHELEAALNPPAESSDVSTPRPTDCAAIRSGEVVVLDRDADGNAGMTMVKT